MHGKAAGNGYFFDAAAIEARGLQTVASLLTTAPSLRANGFSTSDPTRPRVSGRGNCKPSLFVDGIEMRDGIDGLDDQVQVRRVGGIEVYSNPAQAPAQYRGERQLCDDPRLDARLRAVNVPAWRVRARGQRVMPSSRFHAVNARS